jgi:hypothetical protein
VRIDTDPSKDDESCQHSGPVSHLSARFGESFYDFHADPINILNNRSCEINWLKWISALRASLTMLVSAKLGIC